MSLKKFTIITVLLSIALLCVFAEEEAPSEFDFGFNIGLGVDSFTETLANDGTPLAEPALVSYQKLSLSPDFSIGKFGISLDIILHYQFQDGELIIRRLDWVPAEVTFLNVLELYLAKFKYVRWGLKNEPLYAKFGSIEDGLLGNGFILGGYKNTMFLPQTRIFGLTLDVDGALFDFPYVGIETFVGNVIKPDVIGFRPFGRPLLFLDLPIIKNLEVGATFAFDVDPFAYYSDPGLLLEDFMVANNLQDAEPTVFFWGFDVFQPVLSNKVISLAAFGDIVQDQASHTGGMIGCGGALFSLFNFGAQLRILGEGFIPTYFGPNYDLARPYQYALLNSADPVPGFMGWFALLGTSLANGLINLNFTLDGPFKQPITGVEGENNPINFPHLTGSFTIGEGLIPGLSFDASYNKVLIRQFTDIFNAEGAVIYARINYQTGPAVISLFYQLKYNTAGGWSSEEGPDITSGLESLIKLN